MDAANNYYSTEKEGYFITEASIKIGEAVLTGMLYEVSTTLKPGLVTPVSRGSHRDMDYFSFLRSTSAIGKSMSVFAQLGFEYGEKCLPEIRKYGVKIEREMFEATSGVNTQKGLLFLGGVIASAAGFCIKEKIKTNPLNISYECSIITKGIINRELKALRSKDSITSGERIYIAHGITGVRGEIETGLPNVIKYGLPNYREGLKNGLSVDSSLTQSLISIMSSAEDTVVVKRAGIEGLHYVKQHAIIALELGGMYTAEGEAYIKKMDEDFINRNISPGGAADLLAVTVMLHELDKMNLL